MWFWVFLLVMDLLTPLIMIGFGAQFAKQPPKKINPLFGYRTAMSMKNSDTWTFAHHYCGRLWFRWGIFLFLAAVLGMLFALGKDISAIGLTGGVIGIIQVMVLIGTIFPTELALKKKFDQNGNPY